MRKAIITNAAEMAFEKKTLGVEAKTVLVAVPAGPGARRRARRIARRRNLGADRVLVRVVTRASREVYYAEYSERFYGAPHFRAENVTNGSILPRRLTQATGCGEFAARAVEVP